ncbi:MAG: nuclear transport factor 2 family protein [Candidatus Neomarinimicrobiota bacterium]
MNNKTSNFIKIIIILAVVVMMINCSSEKSQNIDLVNQYYFAMMNGDSSIAESILSSSFTKINNGNREKVIGPEVLHKSIRDHQSRNSEYAYILEEIFSDKQFVAVRWRWKSINIKTGTPREMDIPGLAIFRIDSGKIATQWQSFDMVMFEKQLAGDDK